MGWTNFYGSVYHFTLTITVRKSLKKIRLGVTYEFRKLHGIVEGVCEEREREGVHKTWLLLLLKMGA